MATRTNEKPGTCTTCGGEVPPGQGTPWYEGGPDDGGDVVGRTPAGWRVMHLAKADCEAEAIRREGLVRDERERSRAQAVQERAVFEALRRQARERVEHAVQAHGLVPVPTGCQLPPFQREAMTLFTESLFPPGGGASTEVVARVFRVEGGLVAHFGPIEDPNRWATPAVVTAGIALYRVRQWWSPTTHSITAYPGAGVPPNELTENEQAEVATLTAQRDEAKAALVLEQLDNAVHYATVRAFEKTGLSKADIAATWEVRLPENMETYVSAMMEPLYSPARTAASLQVTILLELPEPSFYRGKLRSPIARLIPTMFRVDNHVTANVRAVMQRTRRAL